MNDLTVFTDVPARMIAVELIDDDDNDMRRVAASRAADAALAANIARRGILQPLGVRANGNRFQIVMGRRRLRAARAIGLPSVPAQIGTWTDEEIRAVQLAENMQREDPHPLDVWRSVRELVDAGMTIADAAVETGINERATRQIERLGRLHPAIMALVELEMPRDRELRIIANAPPAAQEKAAKGVRAKPGQFNWYTIAERCTIERIPRSHAIFDAGAVPELWDEDLFAEPDDEDRFSTADIKRFMALQHEALTARVEKERAGKRRVQLAEIDGRLPKLPKGFRLVSTIPGQKPRRTECAFVAVAGDGRIVEVIGVDVAAQKAADGKRKQKAAERAAAAKAAIIGDDVMDESGADDAALDEADGDDSSPMPAAELKPSFSKAGADIIAQTKEQALRTTLRTGLAELPLERLVALLVLMLSSDNIEYRLHAPDDPDPANWRQFQEWHHMRDLARRLLLPGGAITELSGADARALAGEAMARILGFNANGTKYGGNSGAAAEWIGAAVGADQALPRFDTEAFLAAMNGETLRKLAQEAGLKSTGAVGALRASLVGKLPDWRPTAAQFGAPAPAEVKGSEA